MIKNVIRVLATSIMVVTLSACAASGTNGQVTYGGDGQPISCSALGPKTFMGMATGAAIGAGAMAATAKKNKGEAVLIGTVVGAVLGGFTGKSMDAQDCIAAQAALNKIGKAKTGKEIVWKNPKTGNSGTIKPLSPATKTASGICRQYQRSSIINGQKIESVGTTCRDSDGNWTATS